MSERGRDFDQVAELALRFIRRKRPNESPARWDAFAGAVTYAVTGWRLFSERGGPTVRELAAGRACPPYWDMRAVIARLLAEDSPIFGELTDLHRRCWVEEHCFDDDPDDVRELSGQNL